MTVIGFLHTARVHDATFRELFTELAPPGLDDVHLVDESLLADARRTGSAPGLAGRLTELVAAGADLLPDLTVLSSPRVAVAEAVKRGRGMATAAPLPYPPE